MSILLLIHPSNASNSRSAALYCLGRIKHLSFPIPHHKHKVKPLSVLWVLGMGYGCAHVEDTITIPGAQCVTRCFKWVFT